MNWEAIGAVAELLGAVGVIASLVYLALQIRQNTRSLHANTFQTVADSSIHRMMNLAQDDELADRFIRGMIDPSDLQGHVRFQFDLLMRANFKGYENYFYQHTKGMLDDESWNAQKEIIRVSVSPPGAPIWWGQNRHLFRHDFGQLVDSLLASHSTPAA
jgi:hypothetical protein